MLARQNKVTDEGYPIVRGRLYTDQVVNLSAWRFKLHDHTNQTVVLELDDGTRSEPFAVHDRKVLTIPCKRMGGILPGRNSHLFGI